jgi:hypothetical protein
MSSTVAIKPAAPQTTEPSPFRRWLQSPKSVQTALVLGLVFSLGFTLLIYLAAPGLEAFPKLPDQGATWYYWKLAEPTTMSRLTAWGFYLAHQFLIWGLIWYGQKYVKTYTPGLHMVNVAALAVNVLFVVLHFVQSHVWYDGLAQDVHIFTSQWSVIIMLIWIMLMESRRRGLVFGRKVNLGKQVVQFARKYHGYYFAWAIIYTYWFHPMEGSAGHLLGFFYTFILLMQGSLFFTRLHVNKWWMVVMEVTVLAHGTIVAIVQGNNLWPMFLFGFFGVFIITQMWGLHLKRPATWALLALYIGGIVLIWSQRGVTRLWEPIAIPLIYYLGVLVMAAIFAAGIWVVNRVRGKRALREAAA